MVVLVPGGAGYVGSHFCKALRAAGGSPVVFDSLARGHADAVRWGPLAKGDLRDHERIAEVIRQHRPAAVVHFAALAYVGESVVEPRSYYDNNVAGTLNLLAAMLDVGVKQLVFSSTCATYGIPVEVPIHESLPQAPINPYGRSKLMVEQILSDYANAYGLCATALRYFNVAGADPEGELGERHDPETHLIPLALRAAFGRIPYLDVLGNDYPTPDGTCIRDYVHVSDLAVGHLAALARLRDGASGFEAFNLGSDQGFSVLEVVHSVERVTGRKVPVRWAQRRAGDPPVLVSSTARARRELGWAPALTQLDAIVQTAAKWQLA